MVISTQNKNSAIWPLCNILLTAFLLQYYKFTAKMLLLPGTTTWYFSTRWSIMDLIQRQYFVHNRNCTCKKAVGTEEPSHNDCMCLQKTYIYRQYLVISVYLFLYNINISTIPVPDSKWIGLVLKSSQTDFKPDL